MLKKLAILLILIAVPAPALAQQREDKPLSPPERSPVPLTDKDQQRAEEASKKKSGQEKPAPAAAVQIRIPVAAVGRHITSGNEVIDALVHEAATRNGLDPCLLFSVMRAESGFNRVAISPKGASGLMQLMPATASRFGVKNIFDPRENVLGGAKYLRWLLDRFGGDVRLALAGYNAGEGAVEFYGMRIPPFLETQNYVRTIYTRYSRIHGSIVPEPTLAVAQPQADSNSGKYPTFTQIVRLTGSTGDAAPAKTSQ